MKKGGVLQLLEKEILFFFLNPLVLQFLSIKRFLLDVDQDQRTFLMRSANSGPIMKPKSTYGNFR
jgi:hypothetical protein